MADVDITGELTERDELEPVDVDEAPVGDLQRRNHRQRRESEDERGAPRVNNQRCHGQIVTAPRWNARQDRPVSQPTRNRYQSSEEPQMCPMKKEDE